MHPSHHNIPEDFQEKIKQGFEKLKFSQEVGTNEKIRYMVQNPGQEPLVFFEKVEGYVEEDGELVQTQDRFNITIACGCITDKYNPIGGRDYLTGEIVCSRCTCRCFECNNWIAIKNSEEAKGGVCCKRCATIIKVKQIMFFPFGIIKAIGLGLVGKTEEPDTIAPHPQGNTYEQANQIQQGLRPGP